MKKPRVMRMAQRIAIQLFFFGLGYLLADTFRGVSNAGATYLPFLF